MIYIFHYLQNDNRGEDFMKILTSNIIRIEEKQLISEIVIHVKTVLDNSKIEIPDCISLEISHHYGEYSGRF